jgi:biotin carboxyl carrier protein
MRYITTINEREYLVEVLDDHHVAIDGVVYEVDFTSVSGQPVYSVLVNGQSHEAYVDQEETLWQVLLRGNFYPAKVEDEREKRLRETAGPKLSVSTNFSLKAPMPGLVVSLPVQDGSEVKKGDVLVVLESMKMQNELKSPRDGWVSRLRVEAGDSVERNQILLIVGDKPGG